MSTKTSRISVPSTSTQASDAAQYQTTESVEIQHQPMTTNVDPKGSWDFVVFSEETANELRATVSLEQIQKGEFRRRIRKLLEG